MNFWWMTHYIGNNLGEAGRKGRLFPVSSGLRTTRNWISSCNSCSLIGWIIKVDNPETVGWKQEGFLIL